MTKVALVSICAAVAILGAATLAKLPHALRGARIAGQVVDADTGRPIAGAHVAYIWESVVTPIGFSAHNPPTICYHAAATTTDADGRFHIDAWRKWSTYNIDPYDPIALVYAPKYVPLQKPVLSESDAESDPPLTEHLSERYAMKPFAGTVDERMHMLFFGLANRGCHYGGDSQKSLYPMLKTVYYEARDRTSPAANHDRLDLFAVEAAYAALALDPNGPAQDAQLNRFIQENLK